MSDEGRLYTISAVARELKIDRNTLYNWIEKGIITLVPYKRRQYITQETLDYLRTNITSGDEHARRTRSYLLNR